MKKGQKNSIGDHSDETTINRDAAKFPIVTIGCSAGGLNALQSFFESMPSNNGIAFIIVQHREPSFIDYLPDLIKDFTTINVVDALDNMELKPDNIYVVPADKECLIVSNNFKIPDLVSNSRLKMSIDLFLRSFVEERQDKAICIILSGSGMDGSLGLKAVKGAGGLVLVQNIESSEYESMPKNAIATGLADYILAPEDMPEQLLNYLKNDDYGDRNDILLANVAYLDKIFILLHNKTGNDFSNYKKNTILRRIKRRMIVNKIESMESYVRFLQHSNSEIDNLFKELLIGVTNFFRDSEVFDVLKEKVFPVLLNNKKINDSLRIWVTGCSTGEEAYSIAIILKEYFYETKQNVNIQIFATDIDPVAIEYARMGIYPENISADISQERLSRFFNRKDNSYQLKKEIREMIIFAQQNLIKDPPFSKLDIISCRNLLIYLDTELQKKLIPMFHYRLNPDGILILGTSESIGEYSDIFSVVDRKTKIFKRRNIVPYSRTAVDFSLSSMRKNKGKTELENEMIPSKKFNVREFTEKLLLENYMPSSVLINPKLEILHFFGRTGKYLEPANGEASFNISSMAHKDIKKELTAGIRKVLIQKKEVKYENLKVSVNDTDIFQHFNLIIRPILEPEPMRDLLLIIFDEIEQIESININKENNLSPSNEFNNQISILELELNSTREYLQTTIEELETSNEELKSTNEELQSSNEELQSTNEELETSKEELQAVNEELITLNSELHLKIEELSESNNDMHNLLASTNIGTIFLDTRQCIKRFNPVVSKLFNLIQSDIGRPLRHISTNFNYDNLLTDIDNVLDTLVPKEVDILTNDGKYYFIRIIPYRTIENVIEGTVLTFIEITKIKKVEDHLNKLIQVIEKSPSMIMFTDDQGNIEYVNSRFSKITGYTSAEIFGKKSNFFKSDKTPQETFKDLWETIKSGKEWSGHLFNQKKNGDFYDESNIIYPIKNKDGAITHYVAIKEDLSERKKLEEEIKQIR